MNASYRLVRWLLRFFETKRLRESKKAVFLQIVT